MFGFISEWLQDIFLSGIIDILDEDTKKTIVTVLSDKEYDARRTVRVHRTDDKDYEPFGLEEGEISFSHARDRFYLGTEDGYKLYIMAEEFEEDDK